MQPQSQNIIAIGSVEDLFTACFVVIDDLYRQWAPREVMQRPGPAPSLLSQGESTSPPSAY
ncbi:MAG TPA: hypothetical protein VFA32_24505 [Dehalococcoidia bacterium]|jgi:hypothetical protein|nr:hypothetical protein [Dehalococcoidia bacterium]